MRNLTDAFLQIGPFLDRTYFYYDFHIFYIVLFSFLVCVFSIFLILINNPIYSVISLIFVFLFASFLLVFLDVHFLAVLFILVYLGAVVVLFIFIVMMLNIKFLSPLNLFNFLPFLIFSLFLYLFLLDSLNVFAPENRYSFEKLDFGYFLFYDLCSFSGLFDVFLDVFLLQDLKFKVGNYNMLAFVLYSHYYMELIVSSYVLLLAMLGCITLTLGSEPAGLKKQDSMNQIYRKASFVVVKVNE